MRRIILILFLAMWASSLAGQVIVDVCDIAPHVGSLAAYQSDLPNPITMLDKAIAKAGFHERVIPVSTKDPRVQNNARAEPCGTPPHTQNYVFFDPGFISPTPASSEEASNSYFVLAHETGHFVQRTFDPKIQPGSEKERLADIWAGSAMEGLGFGVESVMAGVDYMSRNAKDREIDTQDYRSRCHRRMDALEGYNAAAKADDKLTYDSCLDCFPVSESGLYLGADVSAGTKLDKVVVHRCGRGKPSEDRPTDFSQDVFGACAVTTLKKETQLTWYNIGSCAGAQ